MQPGVTLKVFIDGVGLGERFSEATMSALDWERVDVDSIIARTQVYCPDVIFVVGWRRAVPRKIVRAAARKRRTAKSASAARNPSKVRVVNRGRRRSVTAEAA